MPILTAVDRFTRWPIAVPISDTSAENIAIVFLTHWISTFGVPATLTTGRGSQFQSSLFREFTKLLGCAHITTTAYHPAFNGLVERLHRQLKSALMSQTESASWSDNHPLALLSIRSSVKEDIQCTAAGISFRLPGEFVQSSTTNTTVPSTFVQQLKQRMAQLRPTPTRLTSKRVFVHEDLKSAPFVFVRHDVVRKSLCSLYDGPYKVLQRMDKYYVMQTADKTDTVSIDRLKPAYLECIPPSVVPSTSSAPSSFDPPVSVPSTQTPHSTTPHTHPDSPTTAQRTSSRSVLLLVGSTCCATGSDSHLSSNRQTLDCRHMYTRGWMLRKWRPFRELQNIGGIPMPLALLGASVRGIDLTAEGIEVAEQHASTHDPDRWSTTPFGAPDYSCCSVADVARENPGEFDVLVASEVLEHVSDWENLIRDASLCLKPGGSLFVTTLNKTIPSYILAIVVAERLCGLVPLGTHSWDKFIDPDRLRLAAVRHNLQPRKLLGMTYNPLINRWSWISSLAVNYAFHAVKEID
nr:unnamed protein product [Spirometra erinaceieuropaei]